MTIVDTTGLDLATTQRSVVITALGGGDIRKPPAITPRADKVFITQTPLFASILDGKKSSVLRGGFLILFSR